MTRGKPGIRVPVVGRNLETGEEQEFKSIVAAAEFLDVTPPALQAVVRGDRRSCKGWQFWRQGEVREKV